MDFKTKNRIIILPQVLYIIFLLAIIFFTIFGDSGLYRLHTLNKTKKETRAEIGAVGQQIDLMEKEKVRLTNPDYLESIVRKELGYIKDGEVVYQISP